MNSGSKTKRKPVNRIPLQACMLLLLFTFLTNNVMEQCLNFIDFDLIELADSEAEQDGENETENADSDEFLPGFQAWTPSQVSSFRVHPAPHFWHGNFHFDILTPPPEFS
ncbi:MAG: hypothetical protein H6581_00180 [Bacteroidia bacterium]|nr:hypothetical protein [Bacteroidia bacterium]